MGLVSRVSSRTYRQKKTQNHTTDSQQAPSNMPTGTGWNDEWMTSEGYGKIRQFSLEASRSKVSGFVAKIPGEVDKEDLQKSHITAKHREARRQPVPGIRPAAQIQGEEYRKNRLGKGSNFD